jgi:hypothetical protein
MLERAIRETKETHSIQCNLELQKNLHCQQETFTRIIENEKQNQFKYRTNSQDDMG